MAIHESFRCPLGIRIGDSLSKFIFTLVVDGLSRMLNRDRKKGQLKALWLERISLRSHLHFLWMT